MINEQPLHMPNRKEEGKEGKEGKYFKVQTDAALHNVDNTQLRITYSGLIIAAFRLLTTAGKTERKQLCISCRLLLSVAPS